MGLYLPFFYYDCCILQIRVIRQIRRRFRLSHPPRQRREIRLYIFLTDVLRLSLTTFGGPQVHIALFIRHLVTKRRYLSEAELLELFALCQILPGPTSTQTLTAIAFRIGGPRLAFMALIIWLLPAVIVMTLAAILLNYAEGLDLSVSFVRYMQPVAVALLLHSGYAVMLKVVQSRTMAAVMIISAVIAYAYPSPWVTPILLISSGIFSAIRYKNELEPQPREPLHIEWANFILYAVILVVAILLGHYTTFKPIRLFENFYRNGSLIFGGGQVLVPAMYNEFVEFKHYLTSEEFLSGYALSQVLPGPVFSFCSYIGALSMRPDGFWAQLLGSLMGTIGIFLPGTLLIFFIIRFWEQLKKYRVVKASLQGVNATGAGLVFAAVILLFKPIGGDPVNIGIVVTAFAVLTFTKIQPFWLIVAAVLLGIIF
ncbi:chromate transporter [Flexibacter flexilis DSM 6793]|uniref:Chromate transporter n=1 Tax=Flexibacter flexilis DSM 6793 TaxID=927664 RepID=A0A1I1GM47_9BACT|nr:chromate transporter [Flexibacter flexilis DSM 6793]